MCSSAEFAKRSNKVLLAHAKGSCPPSRCAHLGCAIMTLVRDNNSLQRRVLGIPIVAESFVNDCEKQGTLIPAASYLLDSTACSGSRATAAAATDVSAVWSWAGDSAGNPGAQDVWISYDPDTTRSLEKAISGPGKAGEVRWCCPGRRVSTRH